MSASNDDTHSESLDVAEQGSSNPVPEGDRGPSSQNILTERGPRQNMPSNSPTSRGGRGGGNKSGGRVSSKPKTRKGPNDGNSQSFTLMRTHSAPPDEHAGIFEIGGNGIRYSYGMHQPHQLQQRTMKPGDSRQNMSGGEIKHLSAASEEINSERGGLVPPTVGHVPQPPRGGGQQSSPLSAQQQHHYPGPDMQRGPFPVQQHMNMQPGMQPPHPNGIPRMQPNEGPDRQKVSPQLSPRMAAPAIPVVMMPQYQYPQHMQQQPMMMQQPGRPGMMPQQPGPYPGPQQMQPGMMYFPQQPQGFPQQMPFQGNVMHNGAPMVRVMGGGMMPPGDMGFAPRGPPQQVFMTGPDGRMTQQQLPPAPPVQSFSLQQQHMSQHPQHQPQHMMPRPQMQQPLQQVSPMMMPHQNLQNMAQGFPPTGRPVGGGDQSKKRTLVLKDKHGNVITPGELKRPGMDGSSTHSSPAHSASSSPLVPQGTISNLPPAAAARASPVAAATLTNAPAPPAASSSPFSLSQGQVEQNMESAVDRVSISNDTSAIATPSTAMPPVTVIETIAVTRDDSDKDSSRVPPAVAKPEVAPLPTARAHDVHSMAGSLVITPPDDEEENTDKPIQPAALRVRQPPSSQPVVPVAGMASGSLIIEAPADSSPGQATSGSALDKKTKKSLRKEKFAAADSAGGHDDMLDAYTSAPKKPPTPEPAPLPVVVEKVLAPQPTSVPAKPIIDPDDDWETQVEKIANKFDDEEDLAKPAVRSLRPGGGIAPKSAVSAPTTKTASYVYRKSELLRLRLPFDQLLRPPQCQYFENIVVFGQDNQPLARGVAYGARSPQQPQYGQQMDPRYRNAVPYPQYQMQHQISPMGAMYVGEDRAGWKRGNQGGRKPRQPAPPMPRKVITDPLEAMQREVYATLNKITPETFLKLTHRLAQIEMANSLMLDRLIHIIVGKAVMEPTFAHLYSEMVSILDSENNYMSFCQVVWNRDSNQYFWIKDLQYSNVLAGPYSSPAECVEVSQGKTLPIMQTVNHPVTIDELIVVNGILVNIFRSAESGEYFVTFMPLVDIDQSLMSEACYQTKEAAWKSASKKHGFIKVLVKYCQDEYMASTENTGIYAIPGERREKLNREKSQMTESEIALELAEIEEQELISKRRMMGNVRFIGELCKKGIIKTNIMHECIRDLLFRPVVDEQMLELVCKLLRTVGELLESTANNDQRMAFESYFDKLAALASDKRVNSRIRFSMDEIISLRRNAWQERREADGPALIEEIRMKAATEMQQKEQKRVQQQMQGRGGRGSGRGGRGMHPDPRSPPQPNIVRNVSVGPGSTNGLRRVAGPSTPVLQPPSDLRRISSDPSPASDLRRSSLDSQPYDSPGSFGDSTPSKTSELMDPELASRKTRNIIDEFITLHDHKEAFECLAELPESACGEFVVNYIDVFLNSNKDQIKDTLHSLLVLVMPQLSAAQPYVEASLAKCEAILMLVDTIVDIKNAPEVLGAIVGTLIRGGACRPEAIDQILSEVRKSNSDDEYGYPDSEVAEIHQRFKNIFN